MWRCPISVLQHEKIGRRAGLATIVAAATDQDIESERHEEYLQV